jgi:hypothetical protein
MDAGFASKCTVHGMFTEQNCRTDEPQFAMPSDISESGLTAEVSFIIKGDIHGTGQNFVVCFTELSWRS